MKTSFQLFAGRNVVTMFLAMAALLAVGLACGKSKDAKPIPVEYHGTWTSTDGSTISIRADGSGDYVAGSTKVTGGTVAISDDNMLSVTMLGMGPDFKIDKAPSGGKMTLDGVVYTRTGGGPVASNDSSGEKPVSSGTSGKVPSDSELQTLARTTVLSFNDAIQSGDFADFYGTLATPFKKEVSAEKLAGVFHEFVENKLDFGEVEELDAKFTSKPAIAPTSGFDMLQLKGNYATTPRKTNFDLKYIFENGSWKLGSINIDTK